MFSVLLDDRRRGRVDRVRHHVGALASLGFGVEELDSVGFRLVDHRRPDVLPMARRGRSPVLWFLRLTKAIAEGDPDLEARALRELAGCGYRVDVAGWNRKGVGR